MFYLTTHSKHFIYCYKALDILLIEDITFVSMTDDVYDKGA